MKKTNKNLELFNILHEKIILKLFSEWLNKVKESGVVAWPQDPLTKGSILSIFFALLKWLSKVKESGSWINID